MLQEVKINKLVHGGQGLGLLPDGRKIFVWNALPGETVSVRLTKGKRQYAEAIAEGIIVPAPERIEPRDEAYLSTSPWQIMSFAAENNYKQQILEEAFAREKVSIPETSFHAGTKQWEYRSKMEYSFWADETGLHLALFHRGSHGKRIITGSSIARPEIDQTANKICALLGEQNIRGSQLKTVILRCDQAGNTVAALFVKDKEFPKIKELAKVCRGITVCYSNPKSPASVLTGELYTFGDITLTDAVIGTPITYDVHSFFQVNLPVFELALKRIADFTQGISPKTDFYSGVGTIGLAVNATVLVESDPHNNAMARQNAANQPVQIIEATAETALDYISADGALILDPPRAGLHAKVTEKIRMVRPPVIAYLSCNPSTQARDVGLLEDLYKTESLEGYNFFPRTPHIESLAVLALIK